MITEKIDIKAIKPEYLDQSVVSERHLSGWRDTIWTFWGNRRYKHNKNEPEINAGYLFSLVFSVVSIAFFYYFPFKSIGIIALLSTQAVCIFWPTAYANKSPYIIWGNVIVGTLGLVNHWHFGLSIFGYHFERYLFWGYLFGGLLAVYRRFWNALIWKALDKITFDYYIDHDLDFDKKTKKISDYQKAYDLVTDRLCELLNKIDLKISQVDAGQVQTWLKNHTLDGLDKALQVLDQEIHNNEEKAQ